ncbi:MAG TPA: peptidoglycan recognition family protein [Blastocatellia bacterium]
MGVDLATLEVNLVQARWFHKGRINKVVQIIIHTAECPLVVGAEHGVANYFKTEDRQASAHLTVAPTGIVQSVRLEDTAWAAKNANSNGVHIEHAGYAAFTAAQWQEPLAQQELELSAQLCAALLKHFGLPAVQVQYKNPDVLHGDPAVIQPGIGFHDLVPLHGSHTDPGAGFPRAAYISRVGQILAAVQ